MFNLLSFIDSKDIREYNADTQFTPIEQAYLIYHSRGTTVEEKMAAWRELLDTYDEAAFALTRFGTVRFYEKRSNRQILTDMLTVYEHTLALRCSSEGVVFEVSCDGSPDHVFFPDYASAYAYLCEQKQSRDEDTESYTAHFGEWRNVAITSTIRARAYGQNDWFSSVFHFDRALRLIHLWPNRELFVSDFGTLRYLPIYIPTPFQKGDIVRFLSSELHEYGILENIPDEAYYAAQSKTAYPESDRDLKVYLFQDNDLHGHFDFRYCNVLELERCSEEELPEDQQILECLSSVYKGQWELGDFLYSYSYYGKDAHFF